MSGPTLRVPAPPRAVVDALRSAVAESRDEQLQTLAEWVGMDSPTEDKRLVDLLGNRIESEARGIGMHVTRIPDATYGDHLIARVGPPVGSTPRVLMVGHFDTVYAAGTAANRGFTVEGERAMGPGALDMKGGIIVGLFAIRALLRVFGHVPLPISFLFNSDEEVGSPSSRVPLLQEAGTHDLAVILEPGKPGQAIVLRRKGVGIVHLEVEGIEAHAGAEPENGANAIIAMAHHVRTLDELQDLDLGTTVTPGVIEGGTHPYVVPGRCRLGVDFRVPSHAEQLRVERALEAMIATAPVARTQTRKEGGFHRPPMEPDARTWAAFEGLKMAAAAVDYAITDTSTGGASDGNLTSDAGVPTLDGMGPAGGRAHSSEEYIELESLFRKTEVLAVYLAALAGVEEGS